MRQLEQTHDCIQRLLPSLGHERQRPLRADARSSSRGRLLKGSRGTYESAARARRDPRVVRRRRAHRSRATSRRRARRVRRGRERRACAPSAGRVPLAVARRFASAPVDRRARVFAGSRSRRLPFEQRVVRNYASAVVIMRRFFEDLAAGRIRPAAARSSASRRASSISRTGATRGVPRRDRGAQRRTTTTPGAR